MKIFWLSTSPIDRDGHRLIYGAVEILPDGSLLYTGRDGRSDSNGEMQSWIDSERRWLLHCLGREPTTNELMDYIATSGHYARSNKIRVELPGSSSRAVGYCDEGQLYLIEEQKRSELYPWEIERELQFPPPEEWTSVEFALAARVFVNIGGRDLLALFDLALQLPDGPANRSSSDERVSAIAEFRENLTVDQFTRFRSAYEQCLREDDSDGSDQAITVEMSELGTQGATRRVVT